jgi:transposase
VSDAIIRGWRASLYSTGEQGRLLSLYANHARGLWLGKSVADAAIGTMLRQVAYKADWRGRKLVAADKWFASTKTCCRCGERHAMPLSQRTMRCACGNVMDRDENAAVNLYWYGEEPRNRALLGATRVETGTGSRLTPAAGAGR